MSIITSGTSLENLALLLSKALNLTYLKADIKRFANQELFVNIKHSFHKQTVIILQSLATPANEYLIELLFLINAIRTAGANKIIVIIPYLAYSRQERASTNTNHIASQLIAKILESVKIDQLITLDLHSKIIKSFFNCRITNLDPLPLLILALENLLESLNINNIFNNLIIVSPDQGRAIYAKKLAKLLNLNYLVLKKNRQLNINNIKYNQIITINNIIFQKNCFIIDDIIDSGETLILAANCLKTYGANKIFAFATHPVFSSNAIENLTVSPIERIITTDSIYHIKDNLSKKIEVISILPILALAIKNIIF